MNNLHQYIRELQTCKIDNNQYSVISQQVKLEGIQKLKFISYNVWFDQHNFVERSIELKKIFLNYDPDFICMQEVTQPFLIQLAQDKEICQKYYFSSPFVNQYDVFILSKYPISFKQMFFPSQMGRNLLFGEININNRKIVIGTTHLESLKNNDNYRMEQLKIIKELLSSYDESIFMGDFNMSKLNEEQSIPENYIDIWKALHPNEEGHTMQASKKFPSVRFDRVLLRQSTYWSPSHIEIIGKDPIPYYQNHQKKQIYEIVTPSDHYGLYAEISFNSK
ncbi:endonuclease/exonuclease/phosphatase family protein (macronuclear) [Tetrahymena thermophila SB210]|uniref:Endonuclease/exonuclease/phosphatase family protein n=1 Tax=Tetrahymena thermophila (strain SB210) TaxID=312017 RepID=Q23AA9_TETTS|nr:endonuclease/exonuclease/phosphatase family protein [Tetrahymena thermophila SB210]EAR93583.1 endonuclease/exonuclease/phosphatase family protein [Tetrahymena thermophila SB210]|eukprot:XP_001013828.1 endonuclease/exonuclease/phosphatase family protein [Tetrahymena thermophila SB210]